MYRYHLSFEAEEDIVRIFEFGFGRFGLQQANKYYDMMYDCFDKIASNPFMFPIVSNYKNADRYCVCGVDTIYYNIKVDEIEIITIIGRQDF
ncbi:MAG: type II toxin-antitoxin system RelE/ParE family toxin [Flavobacterium sp.]|nr:type II toxin-antitoxin system RelE/ParE family toxin [Flavobacterium sp.]